MLGVCVKHNGAAPHFKENMMDIKTKTLNSTLNTLKALGAKYVIMMGDTTHSHGDLQVVDKKSRRAKPTYPHGTYIKLVKDQGIESMKVGDVISFDPQGTRAESVRSTAIHYADKHWGPNTVTTTINKGRVEVLRIKEGELNGH